MTPPHDCPAIANWEELLDALPPDQLEDLEHHLQSCPACQGRLDHGEEGEDELRRRAQRVGDPTQTPADPTLCQFLEELHQAKPAGQFLPWEPVDLFFLRPADRPGILGLLGDYEVRKVIGQGGMGVVLQAYEPGLDRLVAIKVLSPALSGSATARRRFTREAQAAAAVSHENIVPVHGVHEIDGLPYLVMQLVAGESLQSRLDRSGPLPVAEIVRIGMQTAAGLAAAHAQGLIHRDIKPANLLLENGRVKITDFGLARMIDDVSLTQNGVVAGTPEYMAPEQARGELIDHRADLFSLGSVLYALCTGVPPFRGATVVAVLRQVSEPRPTPIRSLNPQVPVWLETLISRLMAGDPAQRFQSAAEFLAQLEGQRINLETGSRNSNPRMIPRRLLRAVAGIGCLVGLLGLITAILLVPNPPTSLEPRTGLVCLLVNKNSGRCLSIAGKSDAPGARVIQGPTPDQAGSAERWVLLGPGPAYRLRNDHSGLVLEIGSANTARGVQAIQWHDQPPKTNQLWTFEPTGDGYLLRPGHCPLVLGIREGSLQEGGQAIQWQQVPNVPDQVWELRPPPRTAGDGGQAPAPARAEPPQAEKEQQAETSGWPVATILCVVAALVLLLTLGVGLALWHRRRAETDGAAAPSRMAAAETESPGVWFQCSACGKSLWTRGELAGKKVKCPRCGQAVQVPGG